MANEAIVLTPYAFFARGGATIDSVLVGREAKPDNNPTTNWTDLGIVNSWALSDNGTTETIMKGSPGKVSAWDILKLTDDRTITLEMIEASPQAMQAIFNSAPITSNVFVPGVASRRLQGWLKFQLYNQDDELVLAIDQWSSVTVSNVNATLGQRFAYTMEAQQLYSTLNVGNLTNL